ncbi:MAG: DUF4093 domain-containing protein [Clostridia bacterium]|nr:DUF4093 domain-containing protein [Clostridia bacterium]
MNTILSSIGDDAGAPELSERLRIPYPVIVEGKYDKLKLVSVIDADIITTGGFGIFRNNEKAALIRALASKTPVIILTDPDGAGGMIRSKICGLIPPDRAIRLYVPRIKGTEKRKKAPSAEGVLGVEGISREELYALFLPYAADDAAPEKALRRTVITAADLFRDGFSGGEDSSARRDAAGASLGLPPGMNAKAFGAALSFILTEKEYKELAGKYGKSSAKP